MNTHRCSGFLVVLILLAIPCVSSAQEADTAKRPNILWLIGEDFSPHLGCYGTPQVWTPNLDRLAANGIRYTRAFTTAPVCSASRSAFMTGMYQTTIGAHNHRSHRNDGYQLPEGVKVLTDWLRPAGYFTANIRTFPKKLGIRGTGKTDWNFSYKGKPFDSDSWEDLAKHQPFYAQVNFSETHRTFHAPKKADPAKVDLPPYYPDHPEARADWAAYLDSATELDRKIGLVLKQLAEDGLADNTVVIFFGDHGQAHVRGKQWCYDSGLRIPLIVYLPKGVEIANKPKPGTVNDELVTALDLTATTLALAGVKKPEKMQGRVLLGANAEPAPKCVFGARDRCDETVFRLRTVRDKRYRYIRNFTADQPFLLKNAYKERQYPMIALMRKLHAEGKLTPTQAVLMAPTMPEEELYDLEKDPHEIHNLAKDPEHQETLKRLRQELTRWIEVSDDQGRKPEPASVLEYWQKQASQPRKKQPAKPEKK